MVLKCVRSFQNPRMPVPVSYTHLPDRTQVNTVCLMQGAMPAAPGEMGLDRMYAENNGIAVGDTVTDTNGQTWTVTGYVALPDYSCLFKDNTDTMFDAIKFGVAIVTQAEFDARCV